MRRTNGERVFAVFDYILMTVLGIIFIYPIIYCVSASFSGTEAYINGSVVLLPKDFTVSAYKYIFSDSGMWIAYANTIFYTVVGTAVSMIISVTGAYALSKERLRGRKIFNFLLMVTMWFSAGLIPTFLNIRNLGLLNTRLGIILPFACSTYNIILLRTYFMSVPAALEEAALIDGASDPFILFKIFIPVSMPAIATVTLFYAVGRWNGYFWSMIVLTDDSKMPLQVVLKKLLVVLSATDELSATVGDSFSDYSKETVIYATIIVASLPMLVAYPFIQRFFIKGIMMGSIKG